MRHLASLLLVLVVTATPCFAVDCKSQTPQQRLDEMTNSHRTFVQTEALRTIQGTLRENIRILTRVRGYRQFTPVAQSVELSRGALAYTETVCLPITQTEATAVAKMFVGVAATIANTDDAAIGDFVTSRRLTSDGRRAVGQVAWKGARVAAAKAIERALGDLASTRLGGAVVGAVEGGWVNAVSSVLLTPSEIGPGDAVAGPGSPAKTSSRTTTREGRPDSIHNGSINDAPKETIDRASTTAYVASDGSRAENEKLIAEALAVMKSGGH